MNNHNVSLVDNEGRGLTGLPDQAPAVRATEPGRQGERSGACEP
jgi:hypothetical protein